MTTPTENNFNSLLDRVEAIESRINEIQAMLSNSVSDRALSGTRIILEERIKELELLLSAASSEILRIKTRLNLT